VLADGSQFLVGTQQWEIDYNRTSAAGLAAWATRRRAPRQGMLQ
jgi:hypothetical protein